MILRLIDFANEPVVDLEHAASVKIPRVCLFGSRCFVIDPGFASTSMGTYRETIPRHVEFSARAKVQPVRSDGRAILGKGHFVNEQH